MRVALVWFDIPVRSLPRAKAFYEAVLNTRLTEEEAGMATFDQEGESPGGCLYETMEDAPSASGPLLYFDTERRLDEAAALAELHGGTVVKAPHSIGSYGRRALLLDSEGNRIALHSSR